MPKGTLSDRYVFHPSKDDFCSIFGSSQRDKMFSGKLQQKELEWQSDISQIRTTFASEKTALETQLKNAKSEEGKLKDKLLEAEAVSILTR